MLVPGSTGTLECSSMSVDIEIKCAYFRIALVLVCFPYLLQHSATVFCVEKEKHCRYRSLRVCCQLVLLFENLFSSEYPSAEFQLGNAKERRATLLWFGGAECIKALVYIEARHFFYNSLVPKECHPKIHFSHFFNMNLSIISNTNSCRVITAIWATIAFDTRVAWTIIQAAVCI